MSRLKVKNPKKKRKIGDKGRAFARIIKTEKRDGREWQFHVTKGWRNYRLAD